MLKIEEIIHNDNNIDYIQSIEKSSLFKNENNVELHIYSPSMDLINSNYNNKNFKLSNEIILNNILYYNNIEFNIEKDLSNFNINKGHYVLKYNILENLLKSSIFNNFIIKEISNSRTELKCFCNYLDNIELEKELINLYNIWEIDPTLFDEFYLNFENDKLIYGINIILDKRETEYYILIKLLEPLPQTISLNSNFWIVNKISESKHFDCLFEIEEIKFNSPKLKSANFNIKINSKTEYPTDFKGKDELIQLYNNNNSSLESLRILQNVISKESNITPNFRKFEDFIHFSSIKSRLINFKNKIINIEELNTKIKTLQLSPNSGSIDVYNYNGEINKIINNFSDYENYLYFVEDNEYSWPKDENNNLWCTTSLPFKEWWGLEMDCNNEGSGIINKAKIYDDNNINKLTNDIPSYIHDNCDNDNFINFINLLGEYYDNIWIYSKELTDIWNNHNSFEIGINKNLTKTMLNSLGIEIYTSYNEEDENNFIIPTPTPTPIIKLKNINNSGSFSDYFDISFGNPCPTPTVS